MPYLPKATYGGLLTLRRLARVAAATRGRCLFLAMTGSTWYNNSNGRIVRHACRLHKRVDIRRLPWIVILLDIFVTMPENDRWFRLYHNVDARSFCYPALMAALDREFGADMHWDGSKDAVILVRNPRPGWSPVDWDDEHFP